MVSSTTSKLSLVVVLSRLEALDVAVPSPAVFVEAPRSVFEHDLITLLHVNLMKLCKWAEHEYETFAYRLVRDLLTEFWYDLRVQRLLDELRQLFDGALEVPTRHTC